MDSSNEVLLTKRGREAKEHDGFVYVKEKMSSDKILHFWRCRHVGSCKARLHTRVSTGAFVRVVGLHSDEADPAAIAVAKKRTQLKKRAIQTRETPLQLIENVFASSTEAERLITPSCETLAKQATRARRIAGRPRAMPQNRADIVIPDECAQYESEPGRWEKFLIGDTGVGDAKRILLFGRESVQDWIGFSSKAYVDGTFSLTPPAFSQIVVVLAERAGFVLPVCYALLADKTEDSYRRMIALIKNAWPSFNPGAISMDFEIALKNAFTASFPNAEIHGCLFHLVQNMKKKLDAFHLLSRYQSESDFALRSRCITALAFVPPMFLDDAIAELANELPDDLMPILRYFESTYVGPLVRIREDGSVLRREPLFPISMWSVHERTINGAAKTNNYAEAAHRRLQTEFGVNHPNLWRFIDGLKKVQHHRDILLARIDSGNEPARKRKKYEDVDKRLLNEFDRHPIMSYLKGCASNFVMEP